VKGTFDWEKDKNSEQSQRQTTLFTKFTGFLKKGGNSKPNKSELSKRRTTLKKGHLGGGTQEENEKLCHYPTLQKRIPALSGRNLVDTNVREISKNKIF